MGKEKLIYKSKCDVFKKTNAVDDIDYKNKMMIVFIRSNVSQHFLARLFFLMVMVVVELPSQMRIPLLLL